MLDVVYIDGWPFIVGWKPALLLRHNDGEAMLKVQPPHDLADVEGQDYRVWSEQEGSFGTVLRAGDGVAWVMFDRDRPDGVDVGVPVADLEWLR